MRIERATYRTTHGGASKKIEEPTVFGTEMWHDILLGGAGSGISATLIITEADCLRFLEQMRLARAVEAGDARRERVA